MKTAGTMRRSGCVWRLNFVRSTAALNSFHLHHHLGNGAGPVARAGGAGRVGLDANGHQSDVAGRLAMRLPQLCGYERQLQFYRHNLTIMPEGFYRAVGQ